MRPLPRHLGRLPRRPAERAVPRVARPRVPRRVRRVPRRAGPAAGARAARVPQRGVRRGVARGERGGPARRVGRGPARQGARSRRRGRRGHLPRRRLGHRWRVGAVRRRASAPAATADPTLLLAGARAHNRWLAELCAASPERRAGVALVPIFDVDAAVAEIRRAHESGLRGGILIPSMWQPHAPYHDPRVRPGVGRVRGAADAGARALRRRRQGVVRAARRHLHHRDPVLVVPAAVVPHLVRACSSASPTCGSA